jgi:hypothetical protein
MKGRFIPKHPEKYLGNVNKIMFRSSWELRFLQWLDSTAAVKRWGSEEISIPYLHPFDMKVRNYFPDIVVLYTHKDGSLRKEIIEIKPHKETVATPKMTERDATALRVNKAKWIAAAEYASKNGATFRVVTEKTLFKGTAPRQAPQIGRAV